MTRGKAEQIKVCYQGENDDYIIFVESKEQVEKWKKDRSIPLVQVLNGWKIFCTHKHGAQGILGEASKTSLSSEFGTTDEEEVIKKILECGSPQVSEVHSDEHVADTNPTRGGTLPH